MIKVMIVIESLGRGGAEQMLVSLVPELRHQGIDVLIVIRGGSTALAYKFDQVGISILVMKCRHRWNILGTARELSELAAREKADIVHAHLYFPAVATALMKATKMSAVPACVTFHNLAYAGANRKGMKLAFRRRLAKALYRRGIDVFFGVSAAVAAHYEEAMSLPHVEVIPNPVDLSEINAVSAAGCASRNDLLVLPGRIVQEKGHFDFLQALSLLKDRGLMPKVVLAGDGPLRSEVEARVATLDLSEQVSFSGALAHEDMLQLMATAAVVVVPSRYEGFGLTALESMALGRAVIASDAGGLPEVVGDAGITVPAGNAVVLADAIERLLSEPELRNELGRKAADRAKAFDLPVVAEKQFAAYRKLLDRRE